MKAAIISTILTSCLIFLSGCASLKMSGDPGSPRNPPSPKTPPAADTAVSYHYQKRAWHQLRLTLEADGPNNAEEDRWGFVFKSKISVWRFNPDSGDYDIQVGSGSPVVYSNKTLAYFGDSGDDTFIMVTPTADIHSSGSVGLPNEGHATVVMEVEPKPGPAGHAMIKGETTLSVTVSALVIPDKSAKRRGIAQSMQVTREWKVTPKPGRQVSFVEIAQ